MVSRGGREEVTVARPCEGECVDRGGVKTDFDHLHRVWLRQYALTTVTVLQTCRHISTLEWCDQCDAPRVNFTWNSLCKDAKVWVILCKHVLMGLYRVYVLHRASCNVRHYIYRFTVWCNKCAVLCCIIQKVWQCKRCKDRMCLGIRTKHNTEPALCHMA